MLWDTNTLPQKTLGNVLINRLLVTCWHVKFFFTPQRSASQHVFGWYYMGGRFHVWISTESNLGCNFAWDTFTQSFRNLRGAKTHPPKCHVSSQEMTSPNDKRRLSNNGGWQSHHRALFLVRKCGIWGYYPWTLIKQKPVVPGDRNQSWESCSTPPMPPKHPWNLHERDYYDI